MALPDWLKIRHIENDKSSAIAAMMKRLKLHSVCQSAHCPNRSECWAAGTATFMVMGERCTRGCRFCAVKTMSKPPPLDPDEPAKLADAVSTLGLRYVVVTSVTRDDLPDGGAGHIASCVKALKEKMPNLIVEILVPDFQGDGKAVGIVAMSGADVLSHNVETVERLTPAVRDTRAGYRQSLAVLRMFGKLSGGKAVVKSGLMVGMGESAEEVEQTLRDLREAGVELVTMGQYLAPSKAHFPVAEYVRPERFKEYETLAYSLGFTHVASGPLVRSSYKAAEPFMKGQLR
ncbi:MAG: lipoyl synthase [Candidatus Micrarchaeota archaeon]